MHENRYARSMRLGVLDVGSNTVHLLVVEAHPGARPIPTASHKSVLRLMRYLEPDGAISDEGVAAILAAVGGAASAAREAGIEELLAFATSRHPRGGERRGRARPRRARHRRAPAGALAATTSPGSPTSPCAAGTAGRPGACCSSTSAAVRSRSRRASTRYRMSRGRSPSAPGARRSRSCPTTRPRPNRSRALRAHAREVLAEAVEPFKALPSPNHVVGSSKTIRSLARLAGSVEDGFGDTERSILTRDGLDDWTPRLARIPADARPALPGITADRTFQIVAGAVVLSETMRALRRRRARGVAVGAPRGPHPAAPRPAELTLRRDRRFRHVASDTLASIRNGEARGTRRPHSLTSTARPHGGNDEDPRKDHEMAKADTSGGLSKEERDAVKQRAKELREQEKAGKNRAAGDKAVLDAIAEMEPDDKSLAEGLYKVVTEVAPDLVPKTYYGMPGFANAEGKIVVFIQAAAKFKTRYATIGFEDRANLDDGDLWPIGFAVRNWTPAVEAKVTELVRKAVS